MKIEEFSVDVKKVKNPKGKLVGVASISFRDPESDGMRIYGFKVLKDGIFGTGFRDENGHSLWVAPPSYADSATNRLKNMIHLPLVLWKKIEVLILERYTNL